MKILVGRTCMYFTLCHYDDSLSYGPLHKYGDMVERSVMPHMLNQLIKRPFNIYQEGDLV
jgi:hypothetical protein